MIRMVELIFSARTQAINARVSLFVDGVRSFRVYRDLVPLFRPSRTVQFPTRILSRMLHR